MRRGDWAAKRAGERMFGWCFLSDNALELELDWTLADAICNFELSAIYPWTRLPDQHHLRIRRRDTG